MGALAGVVSAAFIRDEDESNSERAWRIAEAGGRGAAVGLAGGLGALAYAPMAGHIRSAFSDTRLGNAARIIARSAGQAALIGAAVGTYRAVVPRSTGWAKQPVEQRLRTFIPAEVQSWAVVGALMGAAAHGLSLASARLRRA